MATLFVVAQFSWYFLNGSHVGRQTEKSLRSLASLSQELSRVLYIKRIKVVLRFDNVLSEGELLVARTGLEPRNIKSRIK
jgi:hypothetical protein